MKSIQSYLIVIGMVTGLVSLPAAETQLVQSQQLHNNAPQNVITFAGILLLAQQGKNPLLNIKEGDIIGYPVFCDPKGAVAYFGKVVCDPETEQCRLVDSVMEDNFRVGKHAQEACNLKGNYEISALSDQEIQKLVAHKDLTLSKHQNKVQQLSYKNNKYKKNYR